MVVTCFVSYSFCTHFSTLWFRLQVQLYILTSSVTCFSSLCPAQPWAVLQGLALPSKH